MKKTKLTEEICKMRFEEVYSRYKRNTLTTHEAADLLGISERTFYNKRLRFEAPEFTGVFDKRMGRQSNRNATEDEIRKITKLYEERFQGFSAKHFHEFAKRDYHSNSEISICYRHGCKIACFWQYCPQCFFGLQ